MNIRVFFKSIKFAFRAKKRVIPFMMVYAILFIVVSDGLESTTNQIWYLMMALIVSTFYAILISQFRRRDMSVFKCIGWSNSDVMLLVMGEVVLVTVASFLIMLQLSFEILGIVTYFAGAAGIFDAVYAFIEIPVEYLFTTFFLVLAMQIPGLFIAQRRAMSVPPMKALREE